MRVPDSTTRAGVSALAGIAGAAIATLGATLFAAHLRTVGWSIATAAWATVLAVGLVVLGRLFADLVGRGMRWRRLVAVPILLLLVGFVGYPVFTAAYATGQPRVRLGEATPEVPYADVSFRTVDDVLLSGWYLPSTNAAAVVLLHGSSSTRSAVLAHAEVLNRHGYGVLLFDARGHGRSGGEPMDLGWYGDLDIDGAIDHLVTQPDVDPGRIAAVGLSMGGEEAIGAAAADPRIRAVVAEGAQNRTWQDRDDWLPGGVGGWLQRRMDAAAFMLTDLVTPSAPPTSLRDAARLAAPCPMLVIAGSGEEEAARSIQLGAPTSVEVWATGTAHTRGLAAFPEEWTARVVGFLDEALDGASAA